jgi:uncharacterized protein (TIGR03437 family)
LALLSLVAGANAQVSVLNVNYDQQQTGANLQETVIQAAGFNWKNFGKVGTYAVDGQVYAQPLYVPGVTIGGHAHNVVYVASMNNSVYAFDADAPQTPTPLWTVNLGEPVPSGLYNFNDILPQIGILGTPVIDAAKQVIYVVANTLPAGEVSVPIFQLHALSLVDGTELYGGPTLISATVPGNGPASVDGSVNFDATQQLQRPGLLLANGSLYIGFGSHADAGYYHGWLMAYDPTTLQLKSVFNTSPNGTKGALWQSGRAPAVDSKGDVYAVTGNGDFDGLANFGESVLHFSGADLSLKDWYTPQEWSDLNDQDRDVGSSGAIVMPNSNVLLAGGKAGMLYAVQTGSMGHLGADNTSSVQGVQVNAWGVFSLALWPQAHPVVYEWDPNGALKAFGIEGGKINSTILSQFVPSLFSTFCGLALSANGAQNGVVWLVTGDSDVEGIPGTLHALDATNVSNEFWNSTSAGDRDEVGRMAKFATPTVANGRVYVPTFSNTVVVYGLLNTNVASSAISSVVNAASFLDDPVSPGELVTIFGANIGPPVQAAAQVEGQHLADQAADTQVLFDGVAAPILYVSSNQINAIVPYSVTGQSTKVQIVYKGEAIASATVEVQAATPAVFSLNGSGGGPGAILNQDLTVNSGSNPAHIGSVIVIYATGAGATNPPSEDGYLTGFPYPSPNLPVYVTIEGVPAEIVWVSAAPGQVAGMLQINVRVPVGAWIAPFDQVVVQVGDFLSPSAVTVAVVQ